MPTHTPHTPRLAVLEAATLALLPSASDEARRLLNSETT